MCRIVLLAVVLSACLPVVGAAQPKMEVSVVPMQINSDRDDFAPAVAAGGRELYLTSRLDGGQKIYTTVRDGGSYLAPALIAELSRGDENGTTTLTPDGQFMVFSSLENPLEGSGRTDLYVAWRRNGVWTDVQNIGPAVNSPYWDSHPSLSSDGRTLYFASDRPGGFGMVDIWVSRLVSGVWTPAVNAGSEVNSQYDDMSPVIAPDRTTLYLSSNRPGGMGGFDLYVSRKKGDEFTIPWNMGSPINSQADEYFFQALNTAERAFFSSNRAGGRGGIDNYVVTPNPYPSEAVVSVRGIVSDAVSGLPLGSEIVITDLTTRKEAARMRSDDRSGEYVVTLQTGHDYSVTAQRRGYVFFSERYTVPTALVSSEITKDVRLSPLHGGEGTRLMVFFDFNKDVLLPESISELDRLVEFLQENSGLNIKLDGHTDDVGSQEYNAALSQRRADAVRRYLVDAGVSGSRITTEGYGKLRPLVQGTDENARATNRRVELKVIE